MFKGEDFISRIKREKPLKKLKSSGHFKPISDNDLEILMNSSIITTAIDMGFDRNIVVLALKQRLNLKGMPFFKLESCISDVTNIKILEETRGRGGDEGEGSKDEDDDNVFTEEGGDDDVHEEGDDDDDNDVVFTEDIDEEVVHVRREREDIIVDDVFTEEIAPIGREEVPPSVLDSSRRCRICMDLEIAIVFLPCCHMVTCNNCGLSMSHCPICRRDIMYIVKPIVS